MSARRPEVAVAMARHRLRGVYSAELAIDAEDWADRGDRILLVPDAAQGEVRRIAMLEVTGIRPHGVLTVQAVYGAFVVGEVTVMRAPMPGDSRPAVRRAAVRGPIALVDAGEV